MECLSINLTTNNREPCSDWSEIQTFATVSKSPQISIVSLTNKHSAFTSYLIVYEDFSKKLVVLCYFASQRGDHTWRDETDEFNAALSSDEHTGARLSTECKAIMIEDAYSMYCFADLDPNATSDNRILAYFQFQIDNSSNLKITYSQ